MREQNEFFDLLCSSDLQFMTPQMRFNHEARSAIRDLISDFSKIVSIALFHLILEKHSSIMSGPKHENGVNINTLVLGAIADMRNDQRITHILRRDASQTASPLAVFFAIERSALADPSQSDATIEFVQWMCSQPTDTLGAFLMSKTASPKDSIWSDERGAACAIRCEFECIDPARRFALYDVTHCTYHGRGARSCGFRCLMLDPETSPTTERPVFGAKDSLLLHPATKQDMHPWTQKTSSSDVSDRHSLAK